MDSTLIAIALGVIPSIGVGLLFWFVMRTIIRADRNERAAIAEQEAAAARAAEADAPADSSSAPADSVEPEQPAAS
ncbi:hypothetical protein [Demequina sp. NBRC 110054]|uniref:hypothetical protein n=1 Tax=Demequina sp. NBRC 110054 TaxID=1570343 RepID=UPI0009FEF035|nr:hypothetical protein [Demequina sp. NBRC 110054]